MINISRRQFVLGTVAAGAVSAAGHREADAIAASTTPKKGSDVVTLGKTGIRTSILGVGTGTHGGNEQRALGEESFVKMIRHALDRGVTYIDTADAYRTHYLVSKALKGVPRDKCFVQTKIRARHPEVAKADIERFRRELEMPTLDTVLIHCMTKGDWPTEMRPVMDVLQNAKEKGQIRAVGVSCHGFPPLATSSEVDWIDVHLVRINPFGEKMDESPEKVAAELQKMHARGRGVLGMKIYGETGFDSAEKRLQSLKYVLGLGTVDAFTIGFGSIAQIDEALDLIEQATA